MTDIFFIAAAVLGFISFFEPCTIATHTLFSVNANKMYGKERIGTLLLLISTRSLFLSIFLVLLTYFLPAPEFGNYFPPILLIVIATLYIITRYIYLPVPHIELYKLLPKNTFFSQSVKLGLTLPACTIPLFIIIIILSLTVDSIVSAALAGLIFAIFFTLPVIFFSYKGVLKKSQKLLIISAKLTPYITALLLSSISIYLLLQTYTINLQIFQSAIEDMGFLGIALALIAGFIFSFNPVALSSIPVIIAYMTKSTEVKPALRTGIAFIGGLIFTHILLGILAVTTGDWVKTFMGRQWGLVFAPVLIILGFIWIGLGNIRIPWLSFKGRKATGIIGAFLLSIPFTLAICPFCTPILLVVLTTIAAIGSYPYAVAIMLAFSLGRSIIIIMSVWGFDGLKSLDLFSKIQKPLEIVSGLTLIIVGLYFLNEYFGFIYF